MATCPLFAVLPCFLQAFFQGRGSWWRTISRRRRSFRGGHGSF